ncbi:FTR1 family protein [Plastoroseomonas arctica]|uniref:Iron permease FTR1 n=1 Tax=Plastoroseomonas arctica TaxID=1509237 RepID=A0AAF1KP88_9PROT|nr:FTR1 family protein [Plastoroseomonas arctica]MBR0655558.1 iron permease FTR1 [Plastoroseomonas arctica]
MGFLAAAFDTLLILLREGLEAVLVLAALAAFLRRAAPERVGALAWGAALGILASLLAAAAYAAWRDGAHDDRVEGLTCFAAAGLMLWTGGWLARRSDPRAWQAALAGQAQRALRSGRVAWAVAGIGFLAVFREGAETVLFLGAAGAERAGAWPVLSAALVAAIALFVIWRLIARATRRLPLRPLFLGTSLLLLVLALRIAAQGLGEFQEQALAPFTPANLPEALEWVGFAPSWEGLALQGVLALVALVAGWPRRRPALAAAE